MADNLTTQSATLATVPASSVIATDDSGGAHYQIVELADATTPTQRLAIDSSGRITVLTSATKATAVAATAATCDTTADVLLAQNTSRKSTTIQNVGTVDIYIGPASVTTSVGSLLSPGSEFIDDISTVAWYGITGAGTGAVRVLEFT